MRFIVYGPGAIGGVVGSRLVQSGEEVVLIARGAHFTVLRSEGVVLRDPTGEVRLPITTVESPREIQWRDTDVVLVAVKSQHSEAVVSELALHAPAGVAVVNLQNGVRNEPEALRRFPNVYGVPVASPCAHLEPGVVEAYSSPCTGILDVGRFPRGVDEVAESVAAALRRATFDSQPLEDVSRWKWRKLVINLGNAVEAVCGPPARNGPIGEMATAEGEAAIAAAGIDMASIEEDLERRGDLLTRSPVAGKDRPGGSSWQSLARGTHDVESDYLNGEVVLLGRLHGVPTRVNALLQRLANELARTGAPPGSVPTETFFSLLG